MILLLFSGLGIHWGKHQTGAVFLWSYVYNIMRISASKVNKEGKESDDDDSRKLEDPEEKAESLPDKCSEALGPSKGTMDDAYSLLLPYSESEANRKVGTTFTF